ncbi:MAG TPA: hypothetical protein VHD56_16695 [Tepidisphaeraceae bacterium]|nr:hypothetical protein [Tepidisphaeraceae bacterium]
MREIQESADRVLKWHYTLLIFLWVVAVIGGIAFGFSMMRGMENLRALISPYLFCYLAATVALTPILIIAGRRHATEDVRKAIWFSPYLLIGGLSILTACVICSGAINGIFDGDKPWKYGFRLFVVGVVSIVRWCWINRREAGNNKKDQNRDFGS